MDSQPSSAEPLRPEDATTYPDGLLFKDAAAKAQANRTAEEWRRYQFGLAVVESKRWKRPLDRRSGRRGEETAPSTQMLRYLRRVEDLTTGKLRWGMLTNGGTLAAFTIRAHARSRSSFSKSTSPPSLASKDTMTDSLL